MFSRLLLDPHFSIKARENLVNLNLEEFYDPLTIKIVLRRNSEGRLIEKPIYKERRLNIEAKTCLQENRERWGDFLKSKVQIEE